MEDLLSLAENQLHRLRLRVREVKTKRKECQLLVSLVERTLAILHALEATQFESSIVEALGLTKDALEYAQEAVEKCCNAGFFSALLRNETLTFQLKHATEKFKHALIAFPLASIKMPPDVQSDAVALLAQIRNATFEDKEATSHDTKALKDALEREFHRSVQADDDMKIDISLPPHDLTLETGDQRKESLVHREYEDEETKNKEKQHGLESSHNVASGLETLDDVNETPRIVHDLKDCLRCPISKKIMTDPVVLKDSGMTYDRSSIEEWLGRGHGHDPLTHVELVSRDLAPIPALRTACQAMLEQSEAHFSVVDSSHEEGSRPLLELGLYEGEGEFMAGSKKGYASQLLILEPNGGMVGCTLYRGGYYEHQENKVEIGVGKWDGDTLELSFKDSHYFYHGNVEVFASHEQKRLKWSRKVSALENSAEEFASHLLISPPSKGPSSKLRPTILQMEGNIDLPSSEVTFKSKLVLSLEVDFTVAGWTCFDSSMQDSKIVGRIVEGRWDENGCLAFSIHFTHANTPSDYVDAFNIFGIVSHDEIVDHQTFTSTVTRVKNQGAQQNVKKNPTPLSNVQYLEYQYVHEVSEQWHDIHPNALKLFQTPRGALGLDFESTQAISKVTSNVKHNPRLQSERPLGGSSLHTTLHKGHVGVVKENIVKGRKVNLSPKEGPSSLYIASRMGDIDVVKELIVIGADVNLQANNGWTPLHTASFRGRIDVIKELIVNGADVNLQANDGWTPLHNASSKGRIDVVKELIANGAIADLQNKNGTSPLHVASSLGRVSIAQILLENGASKWIINNQGETPYDVVCTQQYPRRYDKTIITQLKDLLKK